MIRRVFFIFLSFFLFFFQKQDIISQYRDPFTEKRKGNNIKKRNKIGLIYATKSLFSKNKRTHLLTLKKVMV